MEGCCKYSEEGILICGEFCDGVAKVMVGPLAAIATPSTTTGPGAASTGVKCNFNIRVEHHGVSTAIPLCARASLKVWTASLIPRHDQEVAEIPIAESIRG